MEPGGVREIPLTRGYVAVVDADDFGWLSQWKWRVFEDGAGHACAVTNVKTATGRSTGYLHRMLLNCPVGKVVDHIDGDPMNNRRSNIRICSRRENTRNGKKRSPGKPYKGVFCDKRSGRYVARIGADYRLRYIGTFRNPEDAARAYDDAARKLHGEFARLNFPEAK